MKIAICIEKLALGGVGTSTFILAKGMREAGHEADILATSWREGDDYERALRDHWPVRAICKGSLWLRRRLETTLDHLTQYEVVINNHSLETQLLLPALPRHILRLSVIRSTDERAISGAALNRNFLDALIGISPPVTDKLREGGEGIVETIPNAVMAENDHPPTLSSPLRIAFVGRLSQRDKNIAILPDIAKKIADQGVLFKIVVAGDGLHRGLLEEKICSSLIHHHISVFTLFSI